MSSSLPDGLAIAAVLPREDPLDAIVLPRGSPASSFDDVAADVNGSRRGLDGRSAEGPEIGTTSVRRIAQLAAVFPGATFAPIRGNVDTRLRKLDSGAFTAIVLAAAGLRRLDLADRITAAIPLERCVPAPGQGTVAIEIRIDDAETLSAVSDISHPATAATLSAERAVVRALGGGCQLPLGALALHEDGGLRLEAVVASPDGARIVRCGLRGPDNDPEALGVAAARELTRRGAMEILDAVRALE